MQSRPQTLCFEMYKREPVVLKDQNRIAVWTTVGRLVPEWKCVFYPPWPSTCWRRCWQWRPWPPPRALPSAPAAGSHPSLISRPKGKRFILFWSWRKEKQPSPPLPAHKHHNVLPSVLVIIISISSRMRRSGVSSRAECETHAVKMGFTRLIVIGIFIFYFLFFFMLGGERLTIDTVFDDLDWLRWFLIIFGTQQNVKTCGAFLIFWKLTYCWASKF